MAKTRNDKTLVEEFKQFKHDCVAAIHAICNRMLYGPKRTQIFEMQNELADANTTAELNAVATKLDKIATFFKDEKTQKVLKKIAVAVAIMAVIAGVIALGVLTHGFGLGALAAMMAKAGAAGHFAGLGLSAAGHAGASHAAVTGVAGTMSKLGVFGGKVGVTKAAGLDTIQKIGDIVVPALLLIAFTLGIGSLILNKSDKPQDHRRLAASRKP